jgi:hypothetical protein
MSKDLWRKDSFFLEDEWTKSIPKKPDIFTTIISGEGAWVLTFNSFEICKFESFRVCCGGENFPEV